MGARVRSPLGLRSTKAFCLLRVLPRSAGWIERVRSCAGADQFLLASMSVPMKPVDVANYSYYESTRLMQNSVIKPS